MSGMGHPGSTSDPFPFLNFMWLDLVLCSMGTMIHYIRYEEHVRIWWTQDIFISPHWHKWFLKAMEGFEPLFWSRVFLNYMVYHH